MRQRTHRRRYDPPDVAYPDSNGAALRSWLNTILGACVVALLAYIANSQAEEKANDRVTNYRLARIERELGIEPISKADAHAGFMSAHAAEVER